MSLVENLKSLQEALKNGRQITVVSLFDGYSVVTVQEGDGQSSQIIIREAGRTFAEALEEADSHLRQGKTYRPRACAFNSRREY